MSIETVSQGAIALLIITSRVISHFEHKKTEKRVDKNDAKLDKIYIVVNSRMDKMLVDEKEKGRQEERDRNNK